MRESLELSVYLFIYNFRRRVEYMNKVIIKILIKLLPKEAKEMIQKMWDFLDGKKTYLIFAGIIIQALTEYVADQDLGKLITTLVLAISGSGARAVAKPK